MARSAHEPARFHVIVRLRSTVILYSCPTPELNERRPVVMMRATLDKRNPSPKSAILEPPNGVVVRSSDFVSRVRHAIVHNQLVSILLPEFQHVDRALFIGSAGKQDLADSDFDRICRGLVAKHLDSARIR